MPEIFASEDEEGSPQKPHLWIVRQEEKISEEKLDAEKKNHGRGKQGVDWFVDVDEYLRTAFRQEMFAVTKQEIDPGAFMLHFKKHDAQERYRYIYEPLSKVETGIPAESEGIFFKDGQLMHSFRTRIREVRYCRAPQNMPAKMYCRGTKALYRTTYIPGDFSPVGEDFIEDEVRICHANAQFVNTRNTLEEFEYIIRHKVYDLRIFLPNTAITSYDEVAKELKDTREYAIVSRPENQGYVSNLPENPFDRYDSLKATSQSTFNGVY